MLYKLQVARILLLFILFSILSVIVVYNSTPIAAAQNDNANFLTYTVQMIACHGIFCLLSSFVTISKWFCISASVNEGSTPLCCSNSSAFAFIVVITLFEFL